MQYVMEYPSHIVMQYVMQYPRRRLLQGQRQGAGLRRSLQMQTTVCSEEKISAIQNDHRKPPGTGTTTRSGPTAGPTWSGRSSASSSTASSSSSPLRVRGAAGPGARLADVQRRRAAPSLLGWGLWRDFGHPDPCQPHSTSVKTRKGHFCSLRCSLRCSWGGLPGTALTAREIR